MLSKRELSSKHNSSLPFLLHIPDLNQMNPLTSWCSKSKEEIEGTQIPFKNVKTYMSAQ